MRKSKKRSGFRATLDIFGYVFAFIIALGIFALIRHWILYHL